MLMALLWVDGRNSRMRWWLTGLALGASFYLLLAWYTVSTGIVQHLTDKDKAALAIDGIGLLSLLAFMTIASTWISFINDIRRLHDLNKSGWWMLAYYAPTFIALGLYLTSGNNPWTIYSYFLPMIASCWRVIELGFISGDSGANDFGDPYGGSFGQMNIDEEVRALQAAAGATRRAPAEAWASVPAAAQMVPAPARFEPSPGQTGFGKRR